MLTDQTFDPFLISQALTERNKSRTAWLSGQAGSGMITHDLTDEDMNVRVKSNRPVYTPTLGCYVVNYSVDDVKGYETFDTAKEGIDWLKEKFPDWFKKHYTQRFRGGSKEEAEKAYWADTKNK